MPYIYIYLYLLFTFSIIHVHVSISPEITHGLCNFGFFFFWFFHGKPKNQKTKIAQTMSVEMGSPEITHGLCNFGFLVFWFSQVFWFSSSEALPKGSQIFFGGVQFWVFGFLGFPPKMAQTMSVLIGSPEIIPWSVPFWVFGFLGFIYKWPPPLKHLFSMKTCLEVGSRGGVTIYLYLLFTFSIIHVHVSMHIDSVK